MASSNCMLALLFVVYYCFVWTECSGDQTECEINWEHSSQMNAYYFISNEVASFNQSLNNCIAMGAILTSVLNQDESDFIQERFTISKYNISDNTIWIGLYHAQQVSYTDRRDIKKQGWSWISNLGTHSNVSWDNWFTDTKGNNHEPTGDSKCARLMTNNDYKWGDKGCNEKFKYICKKLEKTASTTSLPSSIITATSSSTKTLTTTATTSTKYIPTSILKTLRTSKIDTDTTKLYASSSYPIATDKRISTFRSISVISTQSSIPLNDSSNSLSTTAARKLITQSGRTVISSSPTIGAAKGPIAATKENTMTIVYIIIGLALFIIMSILLVGLLIYCRRWKTRESEEENNVKICMDKRPKENEQSVAKKMKKFTGSEAAVKTVPEREKNPLRMIKEEPQINHRSPVMKRINQKGPIIPLDSQSKTVSKAKKGFHSKPSSEHKRYKKVCESAPLNQSANKPEIKTKPITTSKPTIDRRDIASYATVDEIHQETIKKPIIQAKVVTFEQSGISDMYATVDKKTRVDIAIAEADSRPPSTAAPEPPPRPPPTSGPLDMAPSQLEDMYATVERKGRADISFNDDDESRPPSTEVPPPPPSSPPPVTKDAGTAPSRLDEMYATVNKTQRKKSAESGDEAQDGWSDTESAKNTDLDWED